jgi:4a-hydroxytetrahydrobiopterin dehydratase
MAQLLSDDAVAAGLQDLDWTRDGAAITRTVVRRDFAAAMVFVNQVAALAEARNHHPDIAISWNQVTLTLSTHSAGGLTQLDLDLAAAIDALEEPSGSSGAG